MSGPRLDDLAVPYVVIHRASYTSLDDVLTVADIDGCRVILEPRPIRFSYTIPNVRYGREGAYANPHPVTVSLPRDTYLVIEFMVSLDGGLSRRVAGLRVAEVVGLIELCLPGLLIEKIYQGAVNTPNGMTLWQEGPVRVVGGPVRAGAVIGASLGSELIALTRVDAGSRERFQLASRWFARGLETLNQIDKLIYFWTVLEIYPGEGTSDIPAATSAFLATSLPGGRSASSIKARLGLGRTAGLRSRIIHDGKAFVDENEEADFGHRLDVLQAIATTCLRGLAGLEPGHDLDPYLSL
jgi:hypothetical protein